MTNNSKMTIAQFHELKEIPPIVDYSDEALKKEFKYKLLGLVQDAFGDKWYRLSKGTQQALEYICMRSVEQGFFFCGTIHIMDKFKIGKATIYSILRELQDKGVLFKKSRTPTSHNGNGNAVYIFIDHPNFESICVLLGINWKANWKADWKAESDETPCESKPQDDISASTLSLPISLSFIPQDILSNHYNVPTEASVADKNLSTTPVDKSHHSEQKMVKFVPKPISSQFASTLKEKMLPLWRKITQSLKSVKLSVLDRDEKVRKAHEVLRYLVKSKNYVSMSLDEMKAYVYKGMRDAMYNMIGYEILGEMEIVSNEEAYYINTDGERVRTSLTDLELREMYYSDTKITPHSVAFDRFLWDSYAEGKNNDWTRWSDDYKNEMATTRSRKLVIDSEVESCLY